MHNSDFVLRSSRIFDDHLSKARPNQCRRRSTLSLEVAHVKRLRPLTVETSPITLKMASGKVLNANALGPQSEKWSAEIKNCLSPLLHAHRQIPGWGNTNQMHRRERGPGSALSSAVKLAVARVGKRPKDDAGVFIDGTPKIHGEGENHDKEEQIDAKQRMQ